MIASVLMLAATMVFAVGCTKPDNPSDGGSNNGGGSNNEVNITMTITIPDDITSTTVVCEAVASVSQGVELDELGICWSIEHSPTVDDAKLFTLNCSELYIDTITDLHPNTEYHIRAYALYDSKYYYSEEKLFSTLYSFNGHDFVDLGLPSGTLWATCNVGADMLEGSGTRFAWGETQPKDYYAWDNYKFGYYDYSDFIQPIHITKYNYYIAYGHVDNLTILEPEDDAATVNWGSDTHTPTIEEWYELINRCSAVISWEDGVRGWRIKSSNGNSIFLPMDYYTYETPYWTPYWSSSLRVDDYGFPDMAWFITPDYTGIHTGHSGRHNGYFVRPVHSMH